MYSSLFSILNPLVTNKENGTLNIYHENGDQAYILLKKGLIEGIEVGGLTGIEAGKVLATWLSFSTDFSIEDQAPHDHLEGLDTEDFLNLLAKMEKKANEIQMVVPMNGAMFRFRASNLKSEKKFSSKELKVVLALDGKTSVQQVISETGIPELQVLYYIYKFCLQGLAIKVAADSPMEEDAAISLLASLKENLTESVGPAAGIMIDEAFASLDSEPDLIYRSELPQIIEAISHQLDEDESLSFKKWALEYLKSL